MAIRHRTLKSGSKRYFAAVYNSNTGKYIYGKQRKLKREAVSDEVTLISDINSGNLIIDSNKTLNEVARKYFELIASNRINENTKDTYLSLYNNHIRNEIGIFKISNLNSIRIQKLLNEKLKDYSTSTVVKLHIILNQIYIQAVKWKFTKINPLEDVERPSIVYSQRKTWTLSEAKQFLNFSREYQSYIVFWIVLNTGLRFSEVLGLTWDCIDFDNKLISVHQQLDRKTKKLKLKTKTQHGMREVSLSNQQIAILKKHKSSQKPETNIVCSNQLGGFLNQSNVRRAKTSICNKAKIEDISFHEIRHTHATMLIEIGEPIKYVQERLGHSDIKTTLNFYVHTNQSHHQQTADNFSEYFEN